MKGLYGCFFLFVSILAQAQSNYRSNGTGGGNWNLITTWEVENPNGSGTWILASSTPSSASNTIQIRSGDVVNATSNVSVDQTTIDAGAELTISSGITLTVNAGAGDDLIVNGTLTNNGGTLALGGLSSRVARINGTYNNNSGGNSGSTSTRLIFSEGATYNHDFSGSAGTVPTAGWHTNSNCVILSTSDLAPGGLGQAFGNFIWNYAGQTAEIDLGGNPTSVGSFTVQDTGGGAVILGTLGANNLAVLRDFNMQGGVFAFSYVTATASAITIDGSLTMSGGDLVLTQDADVSISILGDFSFTGGNVIDFSQGLGSATISVRGNYTHSGTGNLDKSSGTNPVSAIVFNGTSGNTQVVSSSVVPATNIDYTINSGAIVSIPSENFFGGTGTFTLNGVLQLGSTHAGGAIQVGTTNGNIRIPDANRSFGSGSTIVYNGTGAQFIGDGFPSSGGDVNLTIDNPSGVTLSDDLAIVALRTLTLASGNLVIGAQTLTINGTVTGAGGLTGGSSSNLVIGGTGNFGTLTFAGTNQLLDFTVNRTSSGLITLGGDLQVLGTFTQAAGDVSVGTNTLTVSGVFNRTLGNLVVESGSTVIVNGSGSLPSEVGISGATLGTLTLDRASSTLTVNATIDITNLNLVSGTLANGTGLGITAGGTITRYSTGSMANAPNNTTNAYNVVYNVGSAINSGPELTGSTTALNDLTKLGTSQVTLTKAITVNGDLTLSNGTFNASTFAVTLKGDLVSDATGNFESSALTFGGTSFIRGNTPPNFNNFTVATGSSLNLGTGKTIYVSGNITNDGSIFGGTSTIIFDGSTILDGGGTTALKADFNHVQIASSGTFSVACSACTASNPYRIDVSGDFTVLTGGTFTENASRVRLIGTGTQTLSMNGENFNTLDVAGAGTVILADPLIVSDDLIIRSTGSLNTGSGNEPITIGDDLTIDGTFVPNLGTVVFNGSGGQSINRTEGTSTIAFYNINISKAASTSFVVETPINIQNAIDIDQPGGSYTVDFGGTVSSPLVTLLSDASAGRTGHILAIPDGVTITGNVRINRYMEPAPSGDHIYRYISSPINANPVSQLQDDFPITGTFTGASTCAAFRTGFRNMYYYNEAVAGTSDNGYVGFPTANVSEAMVSGRGYAVQMCDGQSIITWDVSGSIRRAFSGTPVSLPVTYTDNGLPNDDGLNLVGNPFPAPLDWEAAGWTKTNVTNTFWIRNNKETNIASYNGDLNTGTNGATQYIALGQAFWVQASAASPVLSVTEAVKQDQQPEFFRSAPLSDLFRLIVSREGASDEIIVHFDERADGASNTFGDSRKLMSEFMNLYSFTTDSVRLAINSLGALTCSSPVGIGLSDVQPGTYTFTFNGFDSFTDATIMLLDHWKGVTKELNAGTAYTFEVSEDVRSFGNARFQLLFTRGEGIQPVNAEVPQVCEGDAAVLTIHNPQPGIAYYAVNAAGQVVSPTVTAKSDAQLNIDLSLGKGSHELRVMATRADCGVIPAASLASVEILGRPSVETNSGIFICGAGSATVSVTGDSEAVQYNWYESEADTSPLATTALGEWITPELDAARQYYVSASNRLGCEGPRVPVGIELRTVPAPVINLANGKLSTSGSEGTMEWYWQGELVQEGGRTLDIARAGEYNLFVDNNGCEAMATIRVNPEDLSEDARLRVSPNPAVDYVNIEVFSQAEVVNVSLIQSTGQVISSGALNKTGDQYFSGRIDLENTNAGLYILRIDEDNRITYKRLIRK